MSNSSNGWLGLLPQVEAAIVDRGLSVPGWRSGGDDRRRFEDGLARLLILEESEDWGVAKR